MNDDPIVSEVRRVRDKLAGKFGYDIHAVFADLRAHEQQEEPGHPLVHDASQWERKAGHTALTLRDQPRK
jgi:hypothetical protein